jgi:phosphate transport system protein
MVRQSLNALVNRDGQEARRVIEQDDEVDRLHRGMYRRIKQLVAESPEESGRLIELLGAFRNLERMADHAVNISEDVIYMAEGVIVRHHRLKDASKATDLGP